MNIMEYIPRGKMNAVSRKELVRKTGLTDRKLRDMIHEERRNRPILSRDDGGYYLPTKDEIIEVEQFYRRESNRAKSTFWALKSCREWLEEAKQQKETSETFLIEATRCKRCGGILTSSEAVNNGFGHTCLKREQLDQEERKNQVTFDEVMACL